MATELGSASGGVGGDEMVRCAVGILAEAFLGLAGLKADVLVMQSGAAR